MRSERQNVRKGLSGGVKFGPPPKTDFLSENQSALGHVRFVCVLYVRGTHYFRISPKMLAVARLKPVHADIRTLPFVPARNSIDIYNLFRIFCAQADLYSALVARKVHNE